MTLLDVGPVASYLDNVMHTLRRSQVPAHCRIYSEPVHVAFSSGQAHLCRAGITSVDAGSGFTLCLKRCCEQVSAVPKEVRLFL